MSIETNTFDQFDAAVTPTAANAFDAFDSAGPDWNQLFSGLDKAPSYMSERQRKAFATLQANTPNDQETQAASINQAYIQTKLPGMSPQAIQRDWPAVREAFAKTALGHTESGITDTQLYAAIGANEKAKQVHLSQEFFDADVFGKMKLLGQMFGAHVGENAKEVWDDANKPFKALPSAPQMPDVPALNYANPAIVAGVWNSIKPVLEGVETPLGVVTLPILGPLKTLGQTKPLARQALAGISGLFTGLMAKSTYDSAGAAPAVLNDPNATLQQKVEAVGTPVATGALTLLGAMGTVLELKTPIEQVKIVAKLKGKTPEEVAAIFRQEALDPAAKPAEVTALTNAAEKFEGITSKVLEPAAEVKAKESAGPQMLPLDNGGFVVTDAAGKLVDYAANEADAMALVEKAKQAVSEPTMQTEATTSPKTGEMSANAKETALAGIKNEAIDSELVAMGLPKATHGEKLTFEAAVADAAKKAEKDPQAGARLVQELKDNPRPATGMEDALLLNEQNRLRLERDAAEKELIAAQKKADPVALENAQARVAKATSDYQNAAEVVTRVGTENAQGLALRRMMMREDYSLAAMEQRRSVANEGKPLTPAQTAEVKVLYEKIAATQKAFEEYVAKQQAKFPKQPSKVATTLHEQALAARERINARLKEGRVASGLDPIDMADHVIVGADYLARGLTKFGDWSVAMVKEFGERIKPHLQAIFEKATEARKEASRLQAMKTRTLKSTEKLKGKIASKDFIPEPERKPLHLDEEANRLQAEHEMAKLEYDNLLARDRYEKSGALNKIKEQGLNTYDMARAIMTTGEFSFILRQGKVGVLSHPILAAKALPNTFKALMTDPSGAHAINLEVLNHPDAKAALAAKLHLVEEGASLSRQEELIMGKLVGKIPVIGRFNQAATVFLNKLRFDMWNQMRKVGMSVAEEKQLALFVNEATGRGGLGSLEAAAVPLGRLMFSPRYFASRLQLVAGHSLWGGTMATRRVIAKEYARTLVGLGLYYTALELALGDDEGKNKPVIGTDPRSSDFGKVKIGNSRIDPLAGVSQVVVFAARTASGQKTTGTGTVRDIRGENVPYGGDRWSDVAANFARSKLHPVPGSIINLFDGTDLAGNKADITNQALNMAAPITYQDIYQALEEQDLPDGVALSLLAVLGEGLQTYESNQDKKALPRK